MIITELFLPGVLLLKPERHSDVRGSFSEVYNRREFETVGILDVFVQDNHSLSTTTGTIRGLHYQIAPHAVAKLIRVVRGAVFDVVVDVRLGSPTFGQHVTAELSAENWNQLYVPIGYAHGFCTLEPNTEVLYKMSDYWYPEVDRGVLWNDPALGIQWPVEPDNAVVSKKDRIQPRLAEAAGYAFHERPNDQPGAH